MNYVAPESRQLPPDLPAYGVLLLIERFLLTLGDMAAVEFGHGALLAANRAVFAMKLIGLPLRDLASFQFTIDPTVLVCKPIIHLIMARMIALPLRFGESSRHGAAGNNERTKATVLSMARIDFSFFERPAKNLDLRASLLEQC